MILLQMKNDYKMKKKMEYVCCWKMRYNASQYAIKIWILFSEIRQPTRHDENIDGHPEKQEKGNINPVFNTYSVSEFDEGLYGITIFRIYHIR